MKKLIASLLMIAMVVSLSVGLVGCGGKSTTKSTTGATPGVTTGATTGATTGR